MINFQFSVFNFQPTPKTLIYFRVTLVALKLPSKSPLFLETVQKFQQSHKK